MAKREVNNENQMNLFDANENNITQEVSFVNEVLPTFENKVETNSTIKDFLISKENNSIEISGQVKMTRDDFINSIPSEDRFVSIPKIDDNTVTVTAIPEDGSLTLRTMKENFPTFVTQVQKMKELEIIDSMDNMALLEKLENIIEGKKIASIKENDIKKIDSKISSEIANIGDLNSINIDEDSFDDKVEVEVEKKEKNKKSNLKI